LLRFPESENGIIPALSRVAHAGDRTGFKIKNKKKEIK
jgi:hypothetical protein